MDGNYHKAYMRDLKVILRTKNDNLGSVINSLDKSVLKFLIEVSFNILKGVIPLEGNLLLKAKQWKYIFKKLSSRTVSLRDKRKLLNENARFVKFIVKTAVYIFREG